MEILKKVFNKKVLFAVLMVVSTFALSFTAAYYSVYGLSSLFAGSKTAVIIMASALELSKLVIASYLHNHWSRIGGFLKTYLTIGVLVLMLITSAGVYGFLTNAYQSTATELDKMNAEIALVETKRDRYQTDVTMYSAERDKLSTSISELTQGLSNNVIQYKDPETGEIITTTSGNTRRVLTKQLEDFKVQYNDVSDKIETLNDSITSMDLKILDMKNADNVSAELGPLLYMKELTGKPMSSIVNWFTLLIVLVFDPLAIAMVLSLNKYIAYMSGAQPAPKKEGTFISNVKGLMRKRKSKEK